MVYEISGAASFVNTARRPSLCITVLPRRKYLFEYIYICGRRNMPEVYLQTIQTSKMKLFAKIVNKFKDAFRTEPNILDGAFCENC